MSELDPEASAGEETHERAAETVLGLTQQAPIVGADRPVDPGSYQNVGDRISEIIQAAEQAAEAIRSQARADAARIRTEAESAAEARVEELTRDSERLREEADEYSRDMRLAVEAYATKHRREAEQEVREQLEEAEREAQSVRSEARADAEQIQAVASRRQEELRVETRHLEERQRRALDELREIRAGIDDLVGEERVRVEEPPRFDRSGDTIADALAVPQRDPEDEAADQ